MGKAVDNMGHLLDNTRFHGHEFAAEKGARVDHDLDIYC